MRVRRQLMQMRLDSSTKIPCILKLHQWFGIRDSFLVSPTGKILTVSNFDFRAFLYKLQDNKVPSHSSRPSFPAVQAIQTIKTTAKNLYVWASPCLFLFVILCCSAPKLLNAMESCLDWTNVAAQFLESVHTSTPAAFVPVLFFDLERRLERTVNSKTWKARTIKKSKKTSHPRSQNQRRRTDFSSWS